MNRRTIRYLHYISTNNDFIAICGKGKKKQTTSMPTAGHIEQ